MIVMYVLKDEGIISEQECGNNFGYVLAESRYFVSTDYKVLKSQSNRIFVPCVRMLYNGKIELYYITDDYRPMSTMFTGIMPDTLINIVINMFGSIVEVRNNGFLQSQNIDISWDKIFVDPNTLKVKLVYIPINKKAFDSYAEFESELRSSLMKLINTLIKIPNDRLERFSSDLVNGSMTIEDIYNRYKGTGMPVLEQPNNESSDSPNTVLKLVAMNSAKYFEVLLNKPQIVLGKKQELVDVVIGFNKMISRKHCSIFNNGDVYYIADEGSANGTYVNGRKIVQGQKTPIKKGDIIRMADSDFQLV